MPILKMEGRLWHLAKKINKPGEWLENADIRSFQEGKKRIDGLSPSVWIADDVMVWGYRPYTVFVCLAGAFVLVKFIVDLVSFLGSGDFFWFWSFLVSLIVGASMVYWALFSKWRRFVAFDRQRGLVHFSRPIGGGYITAPWQDSHFMKIRWHVPKTWQAGKNDVDFLYFLPPPFRSPKSSLLSYMLRKQVMIPGSEPDELWWLAVHFMCYGPKHQKDMAKMLDERQENCDTCFGGDMTAMQYFVGTRTKVLAYGAGKFERPFEYGKDWKHLDMSKIPAVPSHVIGPDGKWRKLKKHEREAHIPGPAWESLTPEQAEALFEEPHRKRKAERRAS